MRCGAGPQSSLRATVARPPADRRAACLFWRGFAEDDAAEERRQHGLGDFVGDRLRIKSVAELHAVGQGQEAHRQFSGAMGSGVPTCSENCRTYSATTSRSSRRQALKPTQNCGSRAACSLASIHSRKQSFSR